MTTTNETNNENWEETHTRYHYQVDVDVDNKTGKVTVFLWGGDSEVGPAVEGDFDRATAQSIGDAILLDVNSEHFHSCEPEECENCGKRSIEQVADSDEWECYDCGEMFLWPMAKENER